MNLHGGTIPAAWNEYPVDKARKQDVKKDKPRIAHPHPLHRARDAAWSLDRRMSAVRDAVLSSTSRGK